LLRLRRAANPTIQADKLHRVLAGDAFDFLDVGRGGSVDTKIDAVNLPLGNFARIDHPLFAICPRVLLLVRAFVVVLVFLRLDRRQAFLAADAEPVEGPPRGSLVQPRQHDHVPHDPAQGEHAGAVCL
jgi:hypothetical protein